VTKVELGEDNLGASRHVRYSVRAYCRFGLWLSRKPRQPPFRCVEVTTARSRRRSIESNEGVDCCETALKLGITSRNQLDWVLPDDGVRQTA
jgi:hypothetical protein